MITNSPAQKVLWLSLILVLGRAATSAPATNEFHPLGLARAGGFRTHPSQPRIDYAVMRVAFRIGDSTVYAKTRWERNVGPVMVNVHDDENTSVGAAQALIEKTGGQLIELVHTGSRNVAFELKGGKYAFDPNRIFTDAGIARTLRAEGHSSDEAKAEVKRFARQFIEFFELDRQVVVVALHNNSDRKFSAETYAPGGRFESEAAEVYLNPKIDPDDFFFVTDQRFFDYLKDRQFNVVLQNNKGATDDGSLSVYCARKGIPYVNVEAQEGHHRRQLKMLKAVRAMLTEMAMENNSPLPPK